MEFKCKSKELRNSISLVEKAVTQKSSLHILENIYLELKNSTLTLRANNLEIGIENYMTLDESTQEGTVLIKAKTLSGIISKIDDQEIDLKVDENQTMQSEHGPTFQIRHSDKRHETAKTETQET